MLGRKGKYDKIRNFIVAFADQYIDISRGYCCKLYQEKGSPGIGDWWIDADHTGVWTEYGISVFLRK